MSCTKGQQHSTLINENSKLFSNAIIIKNTGDKCQDFINIYNSIANDINNGVLNKDIEFNQENVNQYLLTKGINKELKVSTIKKGFRAYLDILTSNNQIDATSEFVKKSQLSTNTKNYLLKCLVTNSLFSSDEITNLDIPVYERDYLLLVSDLMKCHQKSSLVSINLSSSNSETLNPRGGGIFIIIGIIVVGIGIAEIADCEIFYGVLSIIGGIGSVVFGSKESSSPGGGK